MKFSFSILDLFVSTQKKRDKPATAGQSRLPILKERRTLDNNITLVENRCQLLMKVIINNF
jgi:hypothetical protein